VVPAAVPVAGIETDRELATPLITVILVLWNCEQELAGCLRSLVGGADGITLQVICVDNASEDASVEIARNHGTRVLEMGHNAGFPRAVNAGLVEARGRYVLLLNPDVELGPGSVRRCLDELQDDHSLGLAGANLRRTDGSPDWAAARRFRSLPAIAAETFGLTRLSRRLDFQYLPRWPRTTSRDVDCINGAFMLLETALLRSLGGLDETVFMYLEDQELCRQVRDRSLRTRFVADAVAVHVGGASTQRSSAPRRTIAYLHRLDADIELVARLHGPTARLGAVALFTLRAAFGLGVGVASADADLRRKYVMSLRWLARQVPSRRPPPAIT